MPRLGGVEATVRIRQMMSKLYEIIYWLEER